MKHKILFLISSAWMIGIGFRFILMQEHHIYYHSLFDKFFDWGGLFLFGTTVFYITIFDYLEEKKNEKNSVLSKT